MIAIYYDNKGNSIKRANVLDKTDATKQEPQETHVIVLFDAGNVPVWRKRYPANSYYKAKGNGKWQIVVVRHKRKRNSRGERVPVSTKNKRLTDVIY